MSSHDAFETDAGTTYVVTSQMSGDGPVSPWSTTGACASTEFVDDGYDRITSGGSAGKYLMTDFGYDPSADPGPATTHPCPGGYWGSVFDPSIDWTHGNSVGPVTISSVDHVYLSLKAWDQIVRVNTSSGATLSVSADTAYSDLTLEKDSAAGFSASMANDFGDQHDVHSVGTGTSLVLMFDNTGGGDPLGTAGTNGGSRVLQVALNTTTGKATIKKNWRVVDDATTPAPLWCEDQGSAEWVPTNSNNVLALCNDERVVEELATSDGSRARALFYMKFGSCSNGAASGSVAGWYRAFPVSEIGEFQ